ncbi:MAG: hypothetical protein RLZZ338_3372 [Cyanobacteriota bacterium]
MGSSRFCRGEAFRQISYWLKRGIYYRNASPLPIYLQIRDAPDYRSLGEGLFELKIDYGPGYRLYFGQIASIIVILLCGGDKSTQDRDIEKAREYWRDYYARLENSHE